MIFGKGNIKDNLLKAHKMVEEKDFDGAAALLNEIRNTDVMNYREQMDSGELYLEMGLWNDAIEIFSSILLHDPHSKTALKNIEKAFENINDPFKRKNLYEKLIVHPRLKDRNRQIEILMLLKDYYQKNDNRFAIKETMEMLYRLDPSSIQNLVDLAELYISQGRNDDDAVAIYEKAYHYKPENEIVLKKLSQMYRDNGKDRWRHMDVCIATFIKDPLDIDNIRYMAEVFMRKDETIDESIEKVYETCLLKNMFDAGKIFYHLALFYEKHNKFSQAIKYYEESSRKGYSEKFHYPLLRLGFIFKSMRNLEKAKQNFIAQLKIDPKNNEAKDELRDILFLPEQRTKLTCEELNIAKDVLRIRPSRKHYLYIGNALFKQCGEFQEALQCYNEILAFGRSDREALIGIKECMLKLNKPDEVVSTIKELLSLKLTHNEKIPLLFELAKVYCEKLKDYKNSLRYIDEVIMAEPDNYKAHIFKISICNIYEKNTLYYESLKKAWEIFPDDYEILRQLKEYLRVSENIEASFLMESILVFLGKEKKKEQELKSRKLDSLKLSDCIDAREKESKEILDNYMKKLRIDVGRLKHDQEIKNLLSKSKEARIEEYSVFLKKSCDFLGEMSVTIFEYFDNSDFIIRTSIEDKSNVFIVNKEKYDILSENLKFCYFVKAFSRLKLNHGYYEKSITELDSIIKDHYEKFVKFVESKLKNSDAFVKDIVKILFVFLNKDEVKKVIIDKLLSNLDLIEKYPEIFEPVKDIAGFLIFGEKAKITFKKSAILTLDRIAYAATKDIISASQFVVYEEMYDRNNSDIKNIRIDEILQDKKILNRLFQLWKFAFDVENRPLV